MKTNKLAYILLVLLHITLGTLLFFILFLAKVISILIVVIGLLVIIKTKNKSNEVLYISAYLVSIEVLMRMTGGMFFNEFAKYSIMIFMFVGMMYSGFSKNSVPYWFFLLFLLPGVILSTTSLSLEANIRKAIAFNISGPVCLAVTAIYCYERKVTYDQINSIIISLSLPIISLVTYLFLYSPSVKDVVTGTSSNFQTSGGFGPNQVSTILGLGNFIFFALLLLYSKSKRLLLLHAILTSVIAFRGIITFSRGGIITGIVMILLLLFVIYRSANASSKLKIIYISGAAALFSLAIWAYSSNQTNGLINKRYANQDATGREKEDRLGGREKIAKTEFQMFIDNPILGIGVGKNKEYREETTGIKAASHNEITRLLAEHGTFGIFAFLILFFTPLIIYINNKKHIYCLAFFSFWLLTINHAAMRLAAPAFIYALTLLKVYFNVPKKVVKEYIQ